MRLVTFLPQSQANHKAGDERQNADSNQKSKQVRQQACKTQILPHGLTLRRRPQLRILVPRWPILTAPLRFLYSNATAVTPREPKFTKMEKLIADSS